MNFTQLLEKYDFENHIKAIQVRIANRKKKYVIKNSDKYYELSDEQCIEIEFTEKPKIVREEKKEEPKKKTSKKRKKKKK